MAEEWNYNSSFAGDGVDQDLYHKSQSVSIAFKS